MSGRSYAEYVYAPLQDDEIRVLHLLPGKFDDDIRFHLVHQTLVPYKTAVVDPGLIKRLEGSLPRHWRAYKTPEGRWFYRNTEATKSDPRFTYDHPNPALAPGATAAIRETIQVHPEPTYEPFEALSYAWGDPERTRAAFVISLPSKSDPETTLKLTENLDVALRYLRDSEQIRSLWIDAISINQDDSVERSRQVLRMRQIYSQASRVIAWLGRPSDSSSVALETIAYLGQQVEVSSDGFRLAALHAKESDWFNGNYRLPYSETTWVMINELLARPFFERLWVMQELFLSNENSILQCGDCYIFWRDFRRAVVALDQKTGVPTTLNLNYQITGLRTIAYGASNATMHDVMYMSKQHECSDPRDRVYGAYAFFGPRLRDAIQPSYSASTDSVFRDILLSYCKVSGRLDMLDECILRDDRTGKPSWIPDWTPQPGVSRFPGPGHQASGLSKAYISTSSKEEILKVLGLQVGALKSVYEPIENEREETVIARLSEILAESSTSSFYITGESTRDAWLNTLIEGRTSDRYWIGYFQSLQQWANTVQDSVTSGHFKSESDAGASWSLNTATSNLSTMKFFWTDKGHLGFGHACIEPGDRVCIILGLYVPMILRPKEDSFEVVGWAYVHGLMDAEALLGPLPDTHTVEQHQIMSRSRTGYLNKDTNTLQHDPRLGSFLPDWDFVGADTIELTPDDPICVEHFRNNVTGEVINYDPRMTPEMLKQRGVELETLRLC